MRKADRTTNVRELALIRGETILETKRMDELILRRIVLWARNKRMSKYRIAQEIGMSRTGVANILAGKSKMTPAFIAWAVERGI